MSAFPPNLAIIESPHSDLRATPGQFFLAVPPTFDPYLPQVVFPFRMRGDLVDSFVGPSQVQIWARLGGLRLRGAYGNGFTLPGKGRRSLILATRAGAGAPLLPLIDALVARDCEVAALCRAGAVLESWLPPEVEFRVVDDILAAATPLWAWADTVYASGEADWYGRLLTNIKNERLSLEPRKAQVLLQDLPMPCGIGVCYLCAFKTRRGLVLNCRDGPVFDLADWMVEG